MPSQSRRDADPDLYSTVNRVSATDAVASQIEDLILNDRLLPGDSLPGERQIATQFGVSRNVLREALRSLENKGLVRIAPGQGTFVAEPSAGTLTDSLKMLIRRRSVSLVELTDARRVIEAETASRAAERRTDDQLAELQALLELLDSTRDDPRAHMEADLAFHRSIAGIADQVVFEAVAEALQGSMGQSMLLGSARDTADVQHRGIFEAIQSGDSDAARGAMVEHLDFVRDYLLSRED